MSTEKPLRSEQEWAAEIIQDVRNDADWSVLVQVRRIRNAALEEAARLCIDRAYESDEGNAGAALEHAADAIRALKKERLKACPTCGGEITRDEQWDTYY